MSECSLLDDDMIGVLPPTFHIQIKFGFVDADEFEDPDDLNSQL